jgi:hypothetical protein
MGSSNERRALDDELDELLMSWYGLADDEQHTVHRAATPRQEGKPTHYCHSQPRTERC